MFFFQAAQPWKVLSKSHLFFIWEGVILWSFPRALWGWHWQSEPDYCTRHESWHKRSDRVDGMVCARSDHTVHLHYGAIWPWEWGIQICNHNACQTSLTLKHQQEPTCLDHLEVTLKYHDCAVQIQIKNALNCSICCYSITYCPLFIRPRKSLTAACAIIYWRSAYLVMDCLKCRGDLEESVIQNTCSPSH